MPYRRAAKGAGGKRAIVSLVERGGNVRSFHVAVPMATVNADRPENIARENRLITDESRLYSSVGQTLPPTKPSCIPRICAPIVHTNSVEGFFSIFKRGMNGVYQHCAEKHLHRYLAEFDFRYNTAASPIVNAVLAVQGGEGKRLTYHQPH